MHPLVRARITTQCSECEDKCCTQPYDWVYLTNIEIDKISKTTGLQPSEFTTAEKNPATGDEFKLLMLPCCFYESSTGLCTVHQVRPLVCRLFPVYPEPITGTAMLMSSQCGERLKFLPQDSSDGWSLADHQLDIKRWLRDFWAEARQRPGLPIPEM